MSNSLTIEETEIVMINLRICGMFFVSAILFCIAYYVGRKPKTKKINKEHKGLISPILAEVLIDGKIDTKDLIMTAIVEMHIKKNIEIINDETIRLIHKDNLELHEHYLLDAIFENDTIVDFVDINNRLIRPEYLGYTKVTFLENMYKVCTRIQEKLYKLKLFSVKKKVILNIASYLAMLILINLTTISLGASFKSHFVYLLITVIISLVASLIYFSKFVAGMVLVNETNNEINILKGMGIGTTILMFVTAILTLSMLPIIKFNLFSIFAILVVYLLNFITFKLAKNNVLSEEGIKERKKILELKNYLDNQNLAKQEGTESYIIWDEYFAYAVAFGIPNPVTSKIYSSWKDLNATLSVITDLI